MAGITSVFQINRNLVSKSRNTSMNANQRTVSEADLESEWVEIQAAQSNPAAFQPLYARYYESIYRFIHRRTNQEVLAAEICSDTFLKAMQKLPGYKYQGVPFSAWLFRIASNEVAQYFRANAKNRTVSIEDHTLQNVVEEVAEEDNEQLRQLLLNSLENSYIKVVLPTCLAPLKINGFLFVLVFQLFKCSKRILLKLIIIYFVTE